MLIVSSESPVPILPENPTFVLYDFRGWLPLEDIISIVDQYPASKYLLLIKILEAFENLNTRARSDAVYTQ